MMTQPLTVDSVKSQLNFAANLLQEQEKEYQKNQQFTKHFIKNIF